jgi:probable HAF family extracellular repeat protein
MCRRLIDLLWDFRRYRQTGSSLSGDWFPHAFILTINELSSYGGMAWVTRSSRAIEGEGGDMRLRAASHTRKLLVLGGLALFSMGLRAQKDESTRYVLYEIGTFGGPNSDYNGSAGVITNTGIVVGAANTTGTNPYDLACWGNSSSTCLAMHPFRWRRGTLIDLGVLPGGYGGWVNAANARGVTVGQSDDGEFDPLTGLPVFVATVWDHGEIRNLGTFGGGFSIAISVTDEGFVMGAAENGIVDTSGFAGFDGISQIRGFGWSGGEKFDLGTLGGTGTFPNAMNNSGRITGTSSTSTVPGPFGAAPQAPFLWRKGEMVNLGNLGGQVGVGNAINSRGDVVGASSLASEPFACQFYYNLSGHCHAFFWSQGHMTDLGTLGGTQSAAEEINNSGDAAGFSALPDDIYFHAFGWRQSKMIDLGVIAGDNYSRAFGMNDQGQVVGQSWLWDGHKTLASHAFLWNGSGPMIDLNTLVTNHTDLNLVEGSFITDRGWILAKGQLPNGDMRAAVLVPESDANLVEQ